MKILFILYYLIPLCSFGIAQSRNLDINFKGDAQIEIGNNYMGIEIHHSSPMLQRISFYYPAANSMDLSTDYWKRDSTFIMAAAITSGNKKEWLGLTPYEFNLTPYSASFFKKDEEKEIIISYDFCKEKAAMVVSYEIRNLSKDEKEFLFETHLAASLMTSHSYKAVEQALVEYNLKNSGMQFQFNNKAVQDAQIFIFNAGEIPVNYFTSTVPVNGKAFRESFDKLLWNTKKESGKPIDNPAANFLYKKKLKPNETMNIIQVMGSSKKDEGKDDINYLSANYKKEINDFKKYVEGEVSKSVFSSGDSSLDKTYNWAKAVLAVNKHYINGSIQPMPCPAEYNFYFTHDVLLTDLSAVNFDIARVKKDLQFIISLADKNYIIPHAYYWRDSTYVTEFATPDNWNHFWFIIAAGTYLRHSDDKEFLKKLYPYLTKSLKETLQNKKEDLMWAYRPDWWDIGRNYGPRAYMTIQAIKAIREYVFISAVLGKNIDKLLSLEDDAGRMEKKLNEKLWSEKLNYLINYWENDSLDSHYYIGSLLAASYDLINDARKEQLVKTAKEKLLDPKLGIYTVYPMDFHKMIDFLKFAGNEGGDPFKYINGGIWSHGNAWYILALISAGKQMEAYKFLKDVMTLDGIINSPNGQPAMYEYRNSNYTDSSVYGKIDKPQFMWFAGWYIYSLYHLFGINENEWNISFNPFLNTEQRNCSFDLVTKNKLRNIKITGKGNYISSLKLDGREINCCVIPSNKNFSKAEIILGALKSPMIKSVNAIVNGVNYKDKKLTYSLSSFEGHKIETKVFSPFKPAKLYANGIEIRAYAVKEVNGIFEITINSAQQNGVDNYSILFI